MNQLRLEIHHDALWLSNVSGYIFVYAFGAIGATEEEAWAVLGRVVQSLRAKYGDIRIG